MLDHNPRRPLTLRNAYQDAKDAIAFTATNHYTPPPNKRGATGHLRQLARDFSYLFDEYIAGSHQRRNGMYQ